MTDDRLRTLRESESFQQIMKGLVDKRPVIPDYQPQASRDETENLIERIKYYSAHRAGFDLLFRLLTGKAP